MGYNYEVGDIVKLKKQHPCGSQEWEILRVGADFRLKCTGCGHQIMLARRIVEKNTKDLKNGNIQERYVRINPRDILFILALCISEGQKTIRRQNSMNKYELALVVNAKIEDEALCSSCGKEDITSPVTTEHFPEAEE